MYRATRDGFGAANFHANCDGQSKTVTIIESTRGYIFGGYTKCCWSSGKHVFCHDSNAFLFSLVNKFKKPFLSSILLKEESKAICCNSDYGAIFGYYDIYVSNDSNLSTDSFAVFKSYQKPAFINDPNGFYFCDSKHFQAKEIEVFQI